MTKFVNAQPDIPSPAEMLQDAYDRVSADTNVLAGSSTACIVRLDAEKGALSSANLGDSGYVHLRPDSTPEKRMQVVYLSPAQQYGFNTPYQMAKVPAEMRQDESLSNQPKDAALHEETLEPGDMVLVATDGFFDNIHCKLPPSHALTPDAPQRPELLQLVDMLQDKHREHWAEQKLEPDTPDMAQDFVKVITSTYVVPRGAALTVPDSRSTRACAKRRRRRSARSSSKPRVTGSTSPAARSTTLPCAARSTRPSRGL